MYHLYTTDYENNLLTHMLYRPYRGGLSGILQHF